MSGVLWLKLNNVKFIYQWRAILTGIKCSLLADSKANIVSIAPKLTIESSREIITFSQFKDIDI